MVVAVWTQAAHTCRVELSRSLLGHGSSDLQRTFSGSSADLQRAFSGPSLDLQPLRADRGPDQLVQQNEIVPTSSLELSPGTLFPWALLHQVSGPCLSSCWFSSLLFYNVAICSGNFSTWSAFSSWIFFFKPCIQLHFAVNSIKPHINTVILWYVLEVSSQYHSDRSHAVVFNWQNSAVN